MTIKEVYERFSIPPNLANHMMSVAGICSFINQTWTGSEVDWNTLIKSALLHDLGNVVVIDFDKYNAFGGEGKIDVIYWKSLQENLKEKYGNDDHDATEMMLHEINADPVIIQTIKRKSFKNSMKIAYEGDWPTKILQYADLRVVPTGIVPMEKRIEDVTIRMKEYSSRPDFKDLIHACHEIENEIQQNISVKVDQIDEKSVKVDSVKLLKMEV